MPEFLGVVILYHPDDEVVQRVRTYLDDISTLLVIDNSEQSSPVLKKIQALGTKIKVFTNQSNPGVAFALNQAVDYGLANGFDWLLTMDQDSAFEGDAIFRMKQLIHSLRLPPAIVTPVHVLPLDLQPLPEGESVDVRFTMTSGNLLNLMAARQVGRFLDKLFVDSIDHEYCLRLRRRGYRIIRSNQSVLHHHLGEAKFHRLLLWQVKTKTRPAIRHYYMTRNRLYVATRYFVFDPRACWQELAGVAKSLASIMLFEQNKGTRLAAMLRGGWHFVRGRYGKYIETSPEQ